MRNIFNKILFVTMLVPGFFSFAAAPVKPACEMVVNIVDAQGVARQVANKDCQRQWEDYNTASANYVAPALTMQNTGSASGAYGEISDKSNKGGVVYQVAGAVAGIAGSVYGQQAMSCYSSCSGVACGACAVPAGKATAAIIVAGLANQQANRMGQSAYAACQSANQTSSSQTNCGSPVPDLGNPYNIKNPNTPLGQIGPNGKCLPSAPPSCQAAINQASALSGVPIKNIADNVSAFASDKNPLKISPDGVVKFPDGKSMNVADLMTKEGLMKTGMSAAEADKLMKQLGIAALTKDLNAKKELQDLNAKKNEVDMNGQGGTSATQNSANALNGDKLGQKDLNKKRNPAGEGLTRDFNGERIGASGDDIFNMMNRRYKLKTAQDTFIGK